MTKSNTKNNSASAKVTKVSSQIKAATAEAEKSPTAVKVNTKSTNKPVKSSAKNDSAVKVNIQKSKNNSKPANKANSANNANKSKTSSKTNAPSSSAKSKKTNGNSRVLNVVELGEATKSSANAVSANKALDGMVKPAEARDSEADAEMKKSANSPATSSQSQSSAEAKPKAKKSKKNKKKAPLIALSVTLVVGIIAGVAVWAINRNNRSMCTVDFESNGGSKVDSVEVVCGSKVKQPADPEKEGFEFREWVYRGKKFSFNDSAVNEDIILVAKWDVSEDTETVTISFDSAGGSFVEDVVIKAGTATMPPSDPTREGYSFDGWYLDDKKFDFSEPVEEDITLTAHWSGGNSGQEAPSTNTNNSSRPSNSGSASDGSSSGSAGATAPSNPGSSDGNAGGNGSGNGNPSGGGSGDNSGNTGDGSGDGSGGGDTTVTPGGDDNSNVPNPDNSDQSQP